MPDNLPSRRGYRTPEEDAIDKALDQSTEYPWIDDSIQLICTNPMAKHPAYGATFSDYKKNRNKYMSSTDIEKMRIGFRLPPFISSVSSDIATTYNISHYRFLILILELGIIHFQKDYHDRYEVVKHAKRHMLEKLTTEHNQKVYLQLQKQTIDLETRSYSQKVITPTVAEWLGNAVKEYAVYLNMSNSDFCYLCWCIGTSRSMEQLPSQIRIATTQIVEKFDFELKMYSDRTSHLLSLMKD